AAEYFDGDAHEHITRGHQLLRAGKLRGALAEFCTYMYIDAAGDFAEEASLNARTISAKLGNPTQSDHDACADRARGSSETAAKPTATATTTEILIPVKQPRMYKREIVGLSMVGASIVSLGLALREGNKVVDLRNE